MTWFKSLIMRQNSPLLLIDSDSNSNLSEKESRATLTNGPDVETELNGTVGSSNNNSDNNSNSSSSFIRRLERRQAQVRIRRRSNVPSPSSLTLLPLDYLLQNRCRKLEEVEKITKERNEDEIARRNTNIFGLKSTTKSQRYLNSQRLPHLVQISSASVRMTTLMQPACNNVSISSSTTSCHQEEQDLMKENVKISMTTQKLANTSQETAEEENESKLVVDNKRTSKIRRKRKGRVMEKKFKRNEKSNCNEPGVLISTCLSSFLLLLIASCLTIICTVSAASGQQQQYFEVQPDPQYLVQNGQDLRLRCLIRNRQGECLWLRNGRAVGTIAKKYQFRRQPEDGDCSLMIRNVSVQQDDGIWQCQVTSSDVEQDTLQSGEVHLVVLVPPERPQIKNMVSRRLKS